MISQFQGMATSRLRYRRRVFGVMGQFYLKTEILYPIQTSGPPAIRTKTVEML